MEEVTSPDRSAHWKESTSELFLKIDDIFIVAQQHRVLLSRLRPAHSSRPGGI